MLTAIILHVATNVMLICQRTTAATKTGSYK